jgi:ABC-type glycerol-3-phosphate transport system substrate-binding protein
VSTFVAAYKRDLIDKVGLKPPPTTWSDPAFWTWDTYSQYAEKLTVRSGSETTQWGWTPPHYAAFHPFFFQQLLWQAGGEWLDAAEQKAAFHQAAGIEALQWWLDQMRGKRFMPPVEWITSNQPNETPFINGLVAMTQIQTERMPFLFNGATFRWATALPPKNKRQAVVAGGFGWVVLKGAREREAAAEFVRFATLPAQLVAWALKAGAIPPRKSAGNVPEWQQFLRGEPRWQVHWEATNMGKSFPTVAGWTDVAPIVQSTVRSVLDGNVAPRAALEDAARQADDIFAKARGAS